MKEKILLCIMDGVGERKESFGNAVFNAKTPNLDKLKEKYSYSLLEASEEAVGLPKGQMGNSEVGHMNIGTGRVLKQSITKISDALNDGSFSESNEFNDLIKHIKENNSHLHLFSLLSDGGIHSHIDHVLKISKLLKEKNIDIYYHIFTDGRDTSPHSSIDFIKRLEDINTGTITTISGRYYAMDRDNRWDRIKCVYDEIMENKNLCKNYEEEIKKSYENNITDEFLKPMSFCKMKINDNDGILVLNFRPDRLRELFTALTNESFNEFETKKIKNLKTVTLMPVDKGVKCFNIFKHEDVKNYLGEVLESNNLSQLRIAETEKYAHVTYFFDGEMKKELKNCEKILIPSPKVKTYDLKPEMSAKEITKTLLSKMNDFDVVILNFANGDMVGHTGNYEKTIEAVETVDECIGEIYQNFKGTMIIIADHGNSDYMFDKDGNVITSHSLSKVPLIITKENIHLKNGKLSDVAPTILYLLGLDIPKEMEGDVLIENCKL